MFKKTLLAMTIAGIAGTASAASITATAVNVSVEGFGAQAAAARIIEVDAAGDVTDLTIDLAADLITNDVVEIAFQGATIDTSSVPVITLDATGVPDTASLQFLDIKAGSPNTLRFRVTADVAAVNAAGEPNDDDDLLLSGVVLNPTSAADGAEITVTSKAISSSAAIGEYEIVSTPVDVAAFRNQLEADVDALDGVVDVGNSRLTFTSSGTTDELVVNLVDNSGDVDALTLTTITHTIMGEDFGWVMSYDAEANGGDADGELDAGELAAAVSVATGGDDTFTMDLDLDTNTLTIEQTVNGGAVDAATTVTFTVPGDMAIPEQTFTASIVGDDGTTSATAAAAGTSVGAWTLNGSVFHVPAMYSDANHAALVRAANRGNLDANVELVLYVNGVAKSKGVIGTVGKYSQLNLGPAIIAAAAEEGMSSGYSFDLVFEGSNNAIDITAQYVNKSSASRAVIQVTEL
ncbi:hypothetical protein [Bowmanella dokdonensis]|uniref:Uncharacterized protein n=1 Tax=Bowmanella dokdonensis TaxID=751969 RepID=A0A939DRM1_9ALTE|nr:hypothetical protein [Bowmanella dokdonensis]MBN7827525.1 hypothetical protein [Bowmanella dokdonensis]